MKLSTAIIIAAAISAPRDTAALSIVAPLSGINHLFPGASTHEIDVNAAHANSIDGLGSIFGRHDLTRKYGGRSYGAATLHPGILGRIVEEVGRNNVNAAASDAVHHQVQTLRLTGTSPWHTDCEMDGSQQRKSSKGKPLQVGLFFTNTNEDAYFETQDGELCIPIVEETFVSFDGRVPHRTVVMSGHVDMVGPFSLSSDELLNVAMILQDGDGAEKAAPKRKTATKKKVSAQSGGDLVGISSSYVKTDNNNSIQSQSPEALEALAERFYELAAILFASANEADIVSKYADQFTSAEKQVALQHILDSTKVAEMLGDDAADDAAVLFDSITSRSSNNPSIATEEFVTWKSTKNAFGKAKSSTATALDNAHGAIPTLSNHRKLFRKSVQAATNTATTAVASSVATVHTAAAQSCLVAAEALENASKVTENALNIGTAATYGAAETAIQAAENAADIAEASVGLAADLTANVFNGHMYNLGFDNRQ